MLVTQFNLLSGLHNYGPANATNVVVTDVIPVGLTYVGPTSGIGTKSN